MPGPGCGRTPTRECLALACCLLPSAATGDSNEDWLKLILEDRLVLFNRARPEVVVRRQHAGAGIPAQDRLVVPRGPHRFGLLVPVHRVAERLVRHGPGGRNRLPPLCLGASLGDDAGVIGTLVLVL